MKKANVPKRITNIVCAGMQLSALLMFILTKYATYVNRPNTTIVAEDLLALFDGSGVITFSNLMNSIKLWTILGVVFMILGIVISITSALHNNNDRDGASHTIVSLLSFLTVGCVIIMMSAMCGRAEDFCVITMNISSIKAIFVLLGAAIVCNMLKRSSLITPKVKKEIVVQNSESASHADELKKYKDLLDSGVISQEEFDAKKRQLLGL